MLMVLFLLWSTFSFELILENLCQEGDCCVYDMDFGRRFIILHVRDGHGLRHGRIIGCVEGYHFV